MKKDDVVIWNHKPSIWYNHGNLFKAKGTIIKIYWSCIAGKRDRVKVAKIALQPHDYWKKIKRRTTVVKLEKLVLS